MKYEYRFFSWEEIFVMVYSLDPASNSSLSILHTDTRFLFQKDNFYYCISLLKTSNYFLTYRIKVRFLSLMFKASRVSLNLCASLISDSSLISSFYFIFSRHTLLSPIWYYVELKNNTENISSSFLNLLILPV